MTAREFTLLVEILKATLFVVSASFITYFFNRLAQKREQDNALFNELIKPRILVVHSLNEEIIKIIAEYLEILEQPIAAEYSMSGKVIDTEIQERIDKFREDLPAKLSQVRLRAGKERYLIGEDYLKMLNNRLDRLQEEIVQLWNKYVEQADSLARQMPSGPQHEGWLRAFMERRLSFVIIAHRRMGQLVNDIHDNFTQVVQSKGGASARSQAPPILTVGTGPSGNIIRIRKIIKEMKQAQTFRLEAEIFPTKSRIRAAVERMINGLSRKQ